MRDLVRRSAFIWGVTLVAEVKISERGLVKAWRDLGEESLWVQFRPSPCHDTDEVARAFRQAVRAADDAEEARCRPGDAPRIGGGPVSVTPAGPVVFVDFCDSRTALTTWIDDVAAALSQQGFAGRIGPIHSQPSPVDNAALRNLHAVTAALSLPIDADEVRRDSVRYVASLPHWYVDAATTHAVVQAVMSWCMVEEGNVFLRHELMQFRVAASQTMALVRSALMTSPRVSVTCARAENDFHRVSFNRMGHVTLQRLRPGSTWQDDLDSMIPVVVALASQLEVAFLKRAHVPNSHWAGSINCYPGIPFGGQGIHRGQPLDFIRHLEAVCLPDAYGLQVLTERHLQRAEDLRSWHVSEVAAGRYLVAASDLRPWFAEREPPAHVLDRARESFGSLIVDEEQVQASRAPWA
jgi:hypothetical protein